MLSATLCETYQPNSKLWGNADRNQESLGLELDGNFEGQAAACSVLESSSALPGPLGRQE